MIWKTCTLLLTVLAMSTNAQIFDRGLTTPPQTPFRNLGAQQGNPAWTDSRGPQARGATTGEPLRFNLPAPGPIVKPVLLMPTKPRLSLKSTEANKKVAATFLSRRNKLLGVIREARVGGDSLCVAQSVAALSQLHMDRLIWLRDVSVRLSPVRVDDPQLDGTNLKKSRPSLAIPNLPAPGRK